MKPKPKTPAAEKQPKPEEDAPEKKPNGKAPPEAATDGQGPEPEEEEEEKKQLQTLDFLLSENTLPSAAVFHSMAGNPLMAEVVGRKKFSYRELVIIANTVIGGLDNEVIRLRRYEKSMLQTLGTAINQPLFLPAPAPGNPGKAQAKGKDDPDPDPVEIHWFAKYLTLRNILGVLVVVITLSAGFFAWFNKDYRSLLEAKDGRVSEANQRIEEAGKKSAEIEKQLAIRNTEFDAQVSEVGRLRGDLTKLEALNKSLQTKLDETTANKTAAAGSESQALLAKEKTIGELNTKIAGIVGSIATAESNGKQWKERYDESQKAVAEKSSQMTAAEQKLARANGQLNNAVNAWNDLIGYLYEKDKWGKIEVATDLVKKKLQNLESKTSAVDGMKSVLQ